MNLTLAELQGLISERYLSRGKNYFKEGLEFGPCKHIAATGLAIIKHVNEGGYYSSRDYFDRIKIYKKFNQYLESKNKAKLIRFIMQLSNDYPEILNDFY